MEKVTTMKGDETNSFKNLEVVRIFNKFIHNEATGGIILLLCALIAVIFASVPGGEWFDNIWNTQAGINIGDFSLNMSLRGWINDALMAIFFFTVGLEIKREMTVGQISSFKRAFLPTVAAVGGMLMPALIFTIFNHGTPTAHGWGIPMATDIAFAIGVISLLGSRVPTSLKVFLTALAIVDDLGAIIVLAIFYPTHGLHLMYLLGALAVVLIVLLLNKLKLRSIFMYCLAGIFIWYFIYKSGIHATIAGVILAMLIPCNAEVNCNAFSTKIGRLLNRFKEATTDDGDMLTNPQEQHIIHLMHGELESVDPYLHRFESSLHPLVCYLIMPLFALANAGVAMDFGAFTGGAPHVAFGILFGLLLGKPLGIFLFSFIAIKLGLAERPIGASWLQLFCVSILGGIGFTMSIFISNLAFADPAMVNIAKISILLTSSLAAILGLIALNLCCRKKADRIEADEIMPVKKAKKQRN